MLKRFLQIVAFIICSLQIIFALLKYNAAPTMVSGGSKTLSNLEKPILITICKTSQFNYDRSPLIGYRSSTSFLTGKHSNSTILSWKGAGNMTFNDIKNYLFQSGSEKGNVYADVEDIVTRFLLPYGFCTVAEGKPSKLISGEPKKFTFHLKKGGIYDVYITDVASSLHFQLQTPLTTGDKIHFDIPVNFTRRKTADYTVELTEKQVTTQDGSCTNYPDKAGNANYQDCVEEENSRRILPILGCMVPWMSDEDQCSVVMKRLPEHEDIFKWLKLVYYWSWTGSGYRFSSCSLPCTMVSAHAKFLHASEIKSSKAHTIYIYFNDNVKIETVLLAYGMDSLLVEIGSSLGLWLGLSVVGLFDVLLAIIQKIRQVVNG